MIETKDLMSPLLGASASLTGLTLVFLGIVVTARQSYEADTPGSVLRPFRVDGLVVFGAFIVGVAAVCSAGVWWVGRGVVAGTYVLFVVLIICQVLATVGAATRVLRRVW